MPHFLLHVLSKHRLILRLNAACLPRQEKTLVTVDPNLKITRVRRSPLFIEECSIFEEIKNGTLLKSLQASFVVGKERHQTRLGLQVMELHSRVLGTSVETFAELDREGVEVISPSDETVSAARRDDNHVPRCKLLV